MATQEDMMSSENEKPGVAGRHTYETFDDIPAAVAPHVAEGRGIDAMLNVGMNVQVVIGRARMPISGLLKITRGSVIELDRKIGDPAEITVNNLTIARADLVKLEDGKLGISITEIVKDYIPSED
jgi:flagellar motor switch protein FliN